MAKLYQYTVVGSGAFPVDQLRYDSCWPADTESAIRMFRDRHDEEYRDEREINIESHNPPTEDRWNTFGWRIKENSLRKY
jgi:hypothetical protein